MRTGVDLLERRRVRVWWEGDNAWYTGTITSFSSGRGHCVKYDDGDVKYHSFNAGDETWEFTADMQAAVEASNAAKRQPTQVIADARLPSGWQKEHHKTSTSYYYTYHGPGGERTYSLAEARRLSEDEGAATHTSPSPKQPAQTSDKPRGGSSAASKSAAGWSLSHKAASRALSTQFWQAGKYSSATATSSAAVSAASAGADGLVRARTHPKFLHSNATSHKWAIGAIAELIDNSYDQMQSIGGAVQIRINVLPLESGKPALSVRDNGGGMNRGAMHRMMSFGVSGACANRIGRYGNGFKSSSIRLGADALVLSVARESGHFCAGLLSYSFLRHDGLEDVVVPIVEWDEHGHAPLAADEAAEQRARALSTLLEWGGGFTEARLLSELRKLRPHGTTVLIYNLWENDAGETELDFFSDLADIRTRPADDVGDGHEARKVVAAQNAAAQRTANQAKYFAFKHSLREYVAILYKRHPTDFAILLRGKRVEPRTITKDLKHVRVERYTPTGQAKTYKIHVGFAREAPNVDAAGFNLYYNNRLIKPMWEVYKSPSSVGRGVIGVVEVDFVQPSHDKQDFERTDAMNRLEAKLKLLTPSYWKAHGRRVGYQGADPLPEVRKRPGEVAANASDDDDGGGPPSNLLGSHLFGGREGSRRRKMPLHMGSYQVFHPVTQAHQRLQHEGQAERSHGAAASGADDADADVMMKVEVVSEVVDGVEDAMAAMVEAEAAEVVVFAAAASTDDPVVLDDEDEQGLEVDDGQDKVLEVDAELEDDAAVDDSDVEQEQGGVPTEVERALDEAAAVRQQRQEKLEEMAAQHAQKKRQMAELLKETLALEAEMLAAQCELDPDDEDDEDAEDLD